MLIRKVHSPRRACSQTKAVYNPKASIPHAASLHQACAHCAIFPTAASRRSLGRISVPMWPVTLSGRLPVNALVGHHPANKLIGRDPIPCRKSISHPTMRWSGASGITTRFQELFRCTGQVGHALLTRSPLSPRQQAARDPVRLACVKHAASVHPEPESNPPQKTLQKAKNDSQIHFKRNQTDPLIRKGSHTKNLRHPSKPDRITHTKPCRRTTELAS